MLIERLKKNPEVFEFYLQNGWSLISKVLIAFTGILMNYSISKFYGASEVGLFAIFNSLISFTSLFSTLGLNIYILKLIETTKKDFPDYSVNSILDKVVSIVASFSLIITLLIIVTRQQIGELVFSQEALEIVIILAAIAIVPYSLYEMVQASFRGLRKAEKLIPVQLTLSISKVTMVIVVALMAGNFTIVLGLIIAITALVAIWSMVLARKLSRSEGNDPAPKKYSLSLFKMKEIITDASPLLLTASATLTISHADFLILGYFMDVKAVGYYAVANKLALTIALTLRSINSSTGSLFSRYFVTNEKEKLKLTLKRTSRLSFLVSLPLALLYSIFGTDILGFFCEGVESAFSSLLILTLAQL